MKEYKYAAVTVVPDAVIRQIIDDVFNNIIEKISSEDTYEKVIDIIFETKNEMCGYESPEKIYQIGDYKLSQNNVNKITTFMRQGQKVPAIREFRNTTGCSLTEAKDIIEYFQATKTGAQQFLNSLHLAPEN